MSNMEKHLFNLKFAAKELNRNAKKCDKEEKAEKAKIKRPFRRAIQKLPEYMLKMQSVRKTKQSIS